MLVTFSYTEERVVTVEAFENMSAKDFMALRDTNRDLYDKMMDEAMNKALICIEHPGDVLHITFLDVED